MIGVGADGPFAIDLRADGPHALVAGTTGSGKSELLQTLIASLGASQAPDRLAFLLVDYKGGAAFKDCRGLPHSVGMVTDLDEHEVHRALVSLEAELKRREQILRAAGAKDLLELERRDPAAAPPSLVIVVDEFATLAREVPEFVDGVVDVAQRGRSLGVHLVLATQRPSGAVTDNIRANTKLRIALRVAGVAESEDVIDAPDAARLPRSVPGPRAGARDGAERADGVSGGLRRRPHGAGAARPRGRRARAALRRVGRRARTRRARGGRRPGRPGGHRPRRARRRRPRRGRAGERPPARGAVAAGAARRRRARRGRGARGAGPRAAARRRGRARGRRRAAPPAPHAPP